MIPLNEASDINTGTASRILSTLGFQPTIQDGKKFTDEGGALVLMCYSILKRLHISEDNILLMLGMFGKDIHAYGLGFTEVSKPEYIGIADGRFVTFKDMILDLSLSEFVHEIRKPITVMTICLKELLLRSASERLSFLCPRSVTEESEVSG